MGIEVDTEWRNSHQQEIGTEHQIKPNRASFFEFLDQDKRGFSAASVPTICLIVVSPSKKLAPIGLCQFPRKVYRPDCRKSRRKEAARCSGEGAARATFCNAWLWGKKIAAPKGGSGTALHWRQAGGFSGRSQATRQDPRIQGKAPEVMGWIDHHHGTASERMTSWLFHTLPTYP